MKLLMLGDARAEQLAAWLAGQGETVSCSQANITLAGLRAEPPDFIISYNYRHIIPAAIIDFMRGRIINLHIAYLPWNRGAHPAVWAFIDGTPQGVTIHYIDAGLDTGDIIVQQKIALSPDAETLQSAYDRLHAALQELFRRHWAGIRQEALPRRPQAGAGSRHDVKDAARFMPLLQTKGWNMPVRELLMQLGRA